MGATDTSVPTCVGRLRVRTSGSGPTTVLWHSLFVDRSSWTRVEDRIADGRTLVNVESPGHGGSPAVGHDYVFDDLGTAATEILDHLGLTDPVDWLGSALGGHVGIVFAAAHPERCRSLMTVGAPVHALAPAERRQMRMLSIIHRLVGPAPLISPLMKVMLGATIEHDDPDAWRSAAQAFSSAERPGIVEAIRCASLLRPDLNPSLERIAAPTIFATVAANPVWTVADATESTARLPRGAVAVLPGDGHIGPLFQAPEELAALATAFWNDPLATVSDLQSA